MTKLTPNFDEQNAVDTLTISELPEDGFIRLNTTYLKLGDEIPASQIAGLNFTTEDPRASLPRYSYQRHLLGQPIPSEFIPSQLGGDPYDLRNHGMTAEYVDNSSGWCWDRVGGDWVDLDGVRYGSRAWALVSSSTNEETSIYIDVTNLAQASFEQDRWLAMLVRKTGTGDRYIAGEKNVDRPLLTLEYEDGEVVTVPAHYTCWMTTSTRYVKSTALLMSMPAVIEFPRPTKAVVAATMTIKLTPKKSGACTLSLMLLDPPVNQEPVEEGLAKDFSLDRGLELLPDLLGVHHYLDGTTRESFISNCGLTTTSERDHSPDLWNRGGRDINLLPDRDVGKFIAAGDNFKLVDSSYDQDGFYPLHPGLGAMEVSMPKTPEIGQGSVIDSTGTTGSRARIYMPHHLYGLIDEVYVRYYMMWAPFDDSFDTRYEYYRDRLGGKVVWADKAGKTGITVSHTNRYGFSGSSGGGYGWQLRESWAIRDSILGAPTAGSISHGLHTFDYGWCQPEQQHKYGTVDRGKDKMFGQKGGLGGLMWPGMWYCVEKRVKLNTVMQEAPGYIADGEIDYWIDGRKAFERDGFLMRTLPLVPMDYKETSIRPSRDLGVAYLDFCWYHGGTTENPIDMKVFITGLAWGTKYIGPMRR